MQNVLINAYTPSDQPVTTQLRVHRITTAQHAWYVVKKLGLYWGLALLTFFIPVYNVFFVPFFFLIGVYVALKVERAQYEVFHGKITCPHCQDTIKLRNAVLTEDYQVTCPHCVTVVKVQVKKPPVNTYSEAYGTE